MVPAPSQARKANCSRPQTTWQLPELWENAWRTSRWACAEERRLLRDLKKFCLRPHNQTVHLIDRAASFGPDLRTTLSVTRPHRTERAMLVKRSIWKGHRR